MSDGIYFEIFALKDGVKYSVKTISAKDVSQILANSVMDGLGSIIGFDTQQKEGEQVDG